MNWVIVKTGDLGMGPEDPGKINILSNILNNPNISNEVHPCIMDWKIWKHSFFLILVESWSIKLSGTETEGSI